MNTWSKVACCLVTVANIFLSAFGGTIDVSVEDNVATVVVPADDGRERGVLVLVSQVGTDAGTSVADWTSLEVVTNDVPAEGGTYVVDVSSLSVGTAYRFLLTSTEGTYDLLDYMESSGVQRVMTGVKGSELYAMECGFYDLQYVNYDGIVTSGGEDFCLAMDRSSSGIFVRIRRALPVSYASSPALSTTSCNDVAIYGGRVYVNGLPCGSDYTATSSLASDDGEIRLFMMEGRKAKCRIYYCRLYGESDRTSCLRDLRPAACLADGKNGMWDFRNGGFYANDGGDADLIAGARTNTLVTASAVTTDYSLPLMIAGINAQVFGWEGVFDGATHACSITVRYPTEGATVLWSESVENPLFVLEDPPSYTAGGIYTNLVKVTAAGMDEWIGTGVVAIATYDLSVTRAAKKITATVSNNFRLTPSALVLCMNESCDSGEDFRDWPQYVVLAEDVAPGVTTRSLQIAEYSRGTFFRAMVVGCDEMYGLLDTIESTAQQRICTDVQTTDLYGLTCTFLATGYKRYDGIVAAYPSGENLYLGLNSTSRFWVATRGGLNQNYLPISSTEPNEVSIGNGEINANGTSLFEISKTGPLGTIDCPVQIFSGGHNRAKCRMYACRFYSDTAMTNILRDYRPAVRKSDGACGLYEFRNNEFWPNDLPDGENFIAGSETNVLVHLSGTTLGCSSVVKSGTGLMLILR